ncbi:di-heme oxidoredictase family protein [Cerasicoccus frondis]|uniref:di-heme oxidoredictase family protein n=1 Tax=Cerasicoccus frondis TaxID=490090 RepID=UPI0028526AC4|nr:di-heme oxidoredictase family protein [Cerasicoccus frondis]
MTDQGHCLKNIFWIWCIGAVGVVSLSYEMSAHPSITATPPGISEEYYTGGKQGTVFNTTSRCLEMPAPAVDANPKLAEQFAEGEAIFEADFVVDPSAPFGGLGPIYINNSCRNCHPNYGRGRRVDKFTEQFGNSYTAFVHDSKGKLINGYLFMLQTKATPPYEPLAKGLDIQWRDFVDEYGNKFPDGAPYNEGTLYEGTLIYPEVDIIDPLLPLPEDYQVSIEGTIGLYGTGLLDAIPDADIIAEYERQQAAPGMVKGKHGPWVTEPFDGQQHLGKFTWHSRRATLQNGPGFNGIWNVPNITRSDRDKLFASQEWIEKQAELGHDISQLTAKQPVELGEDDLENLKVWFTGLAVPAARNLNDPQVQRGKQIFHAANCIACHKPNWTTGKSDTIPGYANQKIWPYTDLLMHDMGKANCRACHQAEPVKCKTYTVPALAEIEPIDDALMDDRWALNHGVKAMNHGIEEHFRTPPLWARGLMKTAVDHTDMWHDLRARNFEEAILWHYGEGLSAREAYRNLSKEDREAVIAFLKAI